MLNGSKRLLTESANGLGVVLHRQIIQKGEGLKQSNKL